MVLVFAYHVEVDACDGAGEFVFVCCEVEVGAGHFGDPEEADAALWLGESSIADQGVQGACEFHGCCCAAGVVIGTGGRVTEVADDEYLVVVGSWDACGDGFDGAIGEVALDVCAEAWWGVAPLGPSGDGAPQFGSCAWAEGKAKGAGFAAPPPPGGVLDVVLEVARRADGWDAAHAIEDDACCAEAFDGEWVHAHGGVAGEDEFAAYVESVVVGGVFAAFDGDDVVVAFGGGAAWDEGEGGFTVVGEFAQGAIGFDEVKGCVVAPPFLEEWFAPSVGAFAGWVPFDGAFNAPLLEGGVEPFGCFTVHGAGLDAVPAADVGYKVFCCGAGVFSHEGCE